MTTRLSVGTESETSIAIMSLALGSIEIAESDAIAFPEPVAGFPDTTSYALIPHVRRDGTLNDAVCWLQGLEAPFHAFVMTDPWSVMPDYSPEISDSDAEQLHLRSFEDARVLAILTVPSDGTTTVNLRAPVVFNVTERLAKQVVLLSDQYHTRHPLGR
jgi:flagellar assembly factor FliW